MESLLGGSALGALLGGAFRLVPEVMTLLDKKNEREHELNMFGLQTELAKMQGNMKLQEVSMSQEAQVNQGVLTALKAAVDQQVELVKSASTSTWGSFVAAISAFVRPAVTFWVLLIWSMMHVWLVISSNLPAAETFKLVMTADFLALLSGVINYWFLDRTLQKRNLA